ncbi:MAG: prepilin-type N-terminal cleavage/methylation domain-containing protein [Planctomycetota bacterium]|nr:prepilin-type N-terminal cleavage/methylation domain-containing protein [Planctomycetota bacterium]
MPTDRPCPPSREAFTLVELLIVLAILVMGLAMSWPAVGGLLAKNELRSAAQQVRAALAKTRLEAMESGAVRQFRYQPGTRRFEITRLAATTEQPPARRGVSGDGDATDAPAEVLLASGVRWESPDTTGVLLRPAPSGDASEQAWSAPILFFPNGRTSNARLQLGGRRGFLVPLTLRGVTGTVAIGNLQRAEEQR